jgi:hypothetical protein
VHVVAPVVVQVLAPGLDVTVYPVMGVPPVDAGAVHDTGAEAFWPPVAVTPVGADGGPAGVAAAEGVEAALVPAAFVAVTVNV